MSSWGPHPCLVLRLRYQDEISPCLPLPPITCSVFEERIFIFRNPHWQPLLGPFDHKIIGQLSASAHGCFSGSESWF